MIRDWGGRNEKGEVEVSKGGRERKSEEKEKTARRELSIGSNGGDALS